MEMVKKAKGPNRFKWTKSDPKRIAGADFETTTDPTNLRVHQWGFETLDGRYFTGEDSGAEDFLQKLIDEDVQCVAFHNLRFDGKYVIEAARRCMDVKAEDIILMVEYDFKQWYAFEIVFPIQRIRPKKKPENYSILFIDTAKKMPATIEDISKVYVKEGKMTAGKTKLQDYSLHNQRGIEYTEEDREYMYTDVHVVQLMLKDFKEHGRLAYTGTSDAMNVFFHRFDEPMRSGKKVFAERYPQPTYKDYKEYLTMYGGGLCVLNPKYTNKVIDEPLVSLDFSSKYPSIMAEMKHPFGGYLSKRPSCEHYEWVQPRGVLTIKEGMVPCFLPHVNARCGGFYADGSTAPVQQSGVFLPGVLLAKTQYILKEEWEELLNHYDFEGYYEDSIFMCKAFDRRIADFFIEGYAAKDAATGITKNLRKQDINGPTGRYAKKAIFHSSRLKDEPGVHLEQVIENDPSDDTPVSLFPAMVSVCNAFARTHIREAIRILGPRFVYGDTDSVHGVAYDDILDDMSTLFSVCVPPKMNEVADASGLNVDIYKHKTQLGELEFQGYHKVSKYICAKRYYHETDGVKEVKCAGLPEAEKYFATVYDFNVGVKIEAKLMMRHNELGLPYLKETEFTLSEKASSRDLR